LEVSPSILARNQPSSTYARSINEIWNLQNLDLISSFKKMSDPDYAIHNNHAYSNDYNSEEMDEYVLAKHFLEYLFDENF